MLANVKPGNDFREASEYSYIPLDTLLSLLGEFAYREGK